MTPYVMVVSRCIQIQDAHKPFIKNDATPKAAEFPKRTRSIRFYETLGSAPLLVAGLYPLGDDAATAALGAS